MIYKLLLHLICPIKLQWGNGAYKCERIGNYKQAAQHYEHTKACRGRYWEDHERPLKDSRSTHYKMVRNADNTFDCVLYNTPMVRYFEPGGEGDSMVYLRQRNSSTDKQFVEQMGWRTWRSLLTACSRNVFVPLSRNDTYDHTAANGVVVPMSWSAVLVFNGNGYLLPERSAHRPIYAAYSTKEDRAQRKTVREAVDSTVELLVMRLPVFETAFVRPKQGFYCRVSAYTPRSRVQMDFDLHRGNPQEFIAYVKDPGRIDKVLEFAQSVYDRAQLAADDNDTEVTKDVFRSALLRALTKLAGVSEPTGRREIEQFPEAVPAKFFSYPN